MAIDTTSADLSDQDGLAVTKDGSDELAVWFGGGDSAPTFAAPQNAYYHRTNGQVYRQEDPGQASNWVLQYLFGEDSVFGQNDGPFSTTSATYVTLYSINLDVTADPSGTYRLGWNGVVEASKSNTAGGVRFVVDAGLASEIVVSEGTIIQTPRVFSGFDSGVLDLGIRTLDFQLNRTLGNGNVSISDMHIEAWRVL